MNIKYLGIKKSDKDKFKYVISLVVNQKVKKIYFGANGYNDYIIYNKILTREEADKKKENYIKRHGVNQDWTDPLKAGTLSRYILWNKPTLEQSLDDYLKRFNIDKIPNSAYRSMMMGKLGLTKTTPGKKKDLLRWKNEKWQNLTAKITDGDKFYPCGMKGKKQKEKNLPSVCRPSVKVNDKTPKPLSGSISKQKIKKAVDIKKKGEYIKWNYL